MKSVKSIIPNRGRRWHFLIAQMWLLFEGRCSNSNSGPCRIFILPSGIIIGVLIEKRNAGSKDKPYHR